MSNRKSAEQILLDTGWRTDNMTLAAYLRANGFRFALRTEGQSCWVYFAETETLKQEVMTFLSGEALVNPDEFAKWLGRMKADMYRQMEASEAAAG